MLTSIQGVYRKGRIELKDGPCNVPDETPVIVTFLESAGSVDLRARGIDKKQTRMLRERLAAFAEEWESPEMSAYDNYTAPKARP